MKTSKITKAELDKNSIVSLPTRPTAPVAFGGKGYTSTEMKAAFDKLPTLIAERLNLLLDDIEDGEILAAIPTENSDAPTLAKLVASLSDGTFPSLVKIGGVSLDALLTKMSDDISLIAAACGVTIEEV